MKSTSSRFSFDMIGAAKQEKLLEERHRQRELERQTTRSPSISNSYRDSRFDDMDDFDYDAMMDDDGLEEAIPGVNTDYYEEPIPGMESDYDEEYIPEAGLDDDFEAAAGEEDEDQHDGYDMEDVDNDQENFSGFVFQRSNPQDADGRVIGFAMSKDTPGLEPNFPSPIPPSLVQRPIISSTEEGTGLGIQCLDVVEQSDNLIRQPHTVAMEPDKQRESFLAPPARTNDDLYFDDGISGFDNEFADELNFGTGNDEPFNEALFDLDDTDQYGRPIPGAFRMAKEAHDAAARHRTQEDSDVVSGRIAQPTLSQSTTRTSTSAGGFQHPVSKVTSEEISPQHNFTTFAQPLPVAEQENVVAYQAALAAAAYQAAAAGKFRRESPPTSPAISASAGGPSPTNDYDDYDESPHIDFDDYERDDLDDFNLDDDDIIAEANASALANDSDGWYGQEFGFYSAPASQQNPTTGFHLQSPGLAQLAMMADAADDSNMTLSALLKLRSRAWGGSQASLVSSRDGSPRSERGDGTSSPMVGPHLGIGGFHGRKNSSFSVLSRESENYSSPGSPTLTMSLPAVLSPRPSAMQSTQTAMFIPSPGYALSPLQDLPFLRARGSPSHAGAALVNPMQLRVEWVRERGHPTTQATRDEASAPEKEQGALSRRLEQATEDALTSGGRSGWRAIEEAGFSEELKAKLYEKVATATIGSAEDLVGGRVGPGAGAGTRAHAEAAPWTGEESHEDAALRMLDDSKRKLPPTLRGRPAIPPPTLSRASTRAGGGKGLTEEEREDFLKELRERFQPGARALPNTISGLTSLANQRIEEAMARGQFKDIPRGPGIERDARADNPFIDTVYDALPSSADAGPVFRDPAWEGAERSYLELSVEKLNSLARSYNLMAPELAKKPYFSLTRELESCYAEVAPSATIYEKRGDGYGFKEMWRDIWSKRKS
ncbi:unnamed protein product [Parascedosporium putredinis]|uniref:Uncharacterized protein n=1 Tax=Parascedosporium putredinis TaxID=1442378 RepID=A0A9P1HAD4_9PEZI|nr:unnamed protein product [Parascedosporium putredinis]CAI8002548.1 unnamed protein product [Parascedosporium putredinis]